MAKWFRRNSSDTRVVSEEKAGSSLEKRAANADAKVPPTRDTAPVVNAETAMSIAAVYRSVSILSTSVSQLGLEAQRQGKTVTSPALLKKPDVNATQKAFIEMTVTSLALSGNAYWRLYRANAGAPVDNIEVLNPHNVILDTQNGKRVYKYGDKVFQDYQIKHLKLLRVPGTDYGLGPIQAAKQELTGVLDLRDYQAGWFREAGVPSGVLSTDQTLTSEMADQYKERWNDTNGGVRVLGAGLSYSPTLLNPEDAMFVQVAQLSVTNIARLFGIPASYLLAAVEGNSLTYSNITQVDTAFVKYTLMQYLSEIEEAFSELLPRGTETRFKVEEFLRADIATRFAVYAIARDKEIMTVEEIRKEEGLEPLA